MSRSPVSLAVVPVLLVVACVCPALLVTHHQQWPTVLVLLAAQMVAVTGLGLVIGVSRRAKAPSGRR